MSTPPTHEALSWQQLKLFTGEATEVTLRLGVVNEADHLQWQVEAREASTGRLLSLESVHHASAARWRDELTVIAAALVVALEDAISPF